MIQQIINEGQYQFEGTLKDLKKCINSFKVTKVICQGEIQGLELCEVLGKFRYHGEIHHVYISKYWGDKDILYIKYQGGSND